MSDDRTSEAVRGSETITVQTDETDTSQVLFLSSSLMKWLFLPVFLVFSQDADTIVVV